MSDYEIVCLTDIGKIRSGNEDAVAANPALGLAVLADGMGGYAAGEVASRMAIEEMLRELGTSLPHLQRKTGPELREAMWEDLRFAVAKTNERIYSLANREPDYEGMGSTLVVTILMGERAYVAHLGDSRAYRFAQGHLEQITRDHCWVDEQIAAGLLTEEALTDKRYRNIVTRALGVEEQVELEIHEHPLSGSEIFLMCSDGLSDMLSDADMEAILRGNTPLAQRAQAMVDLANQRGGKDNISVILLREKPPEPTGWTARLKGLLHKSKG